MTSCCFEDFQPDQTITTTGRTITETDLTLFSMISGDWNPIHANAEFARNTRHGQRVVHGALGIAVATGKLHEIGIFERSVIAMLGFREWLFKAPILVGDTLRLELTILDTEPCRSGRVGRRFRLLNQRDEVVQEGVSDVLVLTRASAEAEGA